MERKSVKHLAQINKGSIPDNIWETPFDSRFEQNAHPMHTFTDTCKQLGLDPKIDVCAEPSNAKCEKFFTPEQNGLTQAWDQDFFGNFPYSEVGTWIAKAFVEWFNYNVNGLILCFSKTDTKWWHKFVEGKAEVYFVEKRINFWKDGKIPLITTKKNPKPHYCPAPYPSCWLVYRKREKSAKELFSEIMENKRKI